MSAGAIAGNFLRKLALLALLVLAACEQPEPARIAPAKRTIARSSVTPPPAAAMQTGEAPPYMPDSVFRPETHRPAGASLPRDALLVRDVITGEDTLEFSYFGEAVAIDGDVAVIGAPYADHGWKTDAGAAYVFRRDGERWRQEAKLLAPKPQPFERFGVSVAISGDAVVAGADRSNQRGHTGSGAAYAYVRGDSGWRHAATLLPSQLGDRAALGWSVALQRDVAVICAPGIDAAFVFRDWKETARIDGEARTGFGHSVALDGDAIVIGAITDSDPLLLGGAAYVYRNGALEAELQPARPQELARFGAAVAIRGDRALVSAPRATVNGRPRAGAAWLFARDATGWREVQELTSEPPRSDEELGRALSLSDGGAVIGSQFSDAAGLNTGGAILFDFDRGRDRLVRRGTLLAHDLKFMHEFAFAVAASDRHVVIGAPRRGENDNATGYAYVYRRE